MRLVVLSHYWTPEVGAPQTRLSETARLLCKLGWEVSVVTNHPHYPSGLVQAGYRALSVRREVIDSVHVLRLPVLARPNRGFLDRVVDQGSFAMSAAAAVRFVKQADVMLVESPPLFLGATARWLRATTGVPYVFHVADPWPDYPIELGALRHPVAVRLARSLERHAYAGASAITTPTGGCADLIRQQPQTVNKVIVLPNGVDLSRFEPSGTQAVARAKLGWEDRPTVVYVGTVGLAQGLSTLLASAAMLFRNSATDHGPLIRIVGDGQDRQSLERQATERGLTNVRFDRPVAGREVPRILQAADAAVVLLRGGRLADAALPTKLVEAMAAARPVIASANGEAAQVIRDAQAGVTVPAEDPVALAKAISDVFEAPNALRAQGLNARAAAEARFDRSKIATRLSSILADAADAWM